MEGASDSLKIQFANDLFQFNEDYKTEVNFVYEEETKDDQLTVKAVTLTVQTIMKTAVLDGDLQLELKSKVKNETSSLPLTVEKSLVENPDYEIIVKARLQSANKQIFELIQNLQNEDPKLRSASYETLKVLDRDVDLFMEDAQKFKNRDSKKELMQQALECKKKIAKVMEVMRECLDNRMTNLQIAQLNDCAYKAIRKAGVQKKLDERAIKNEAYFKMNEEKLDKLVAGLNVEKIRANK